MEFSMKGLSERRKRFGLDCSAAVEPSMTQQCFADECNINNILAGYERGQLSEFSRDVDAGVYADLTGVEDYHSSLNKVIAANDAFFALPAQIRASFENDPSKLLAFLADPANRDKAIELGLVDKPPTPPAAPSSEPPTAPAGA